MFYLLTSTAKNQIHLVAYFISNFAKSVCLHVPGYILVTFAECCILSSARTNLPFVT